MQFSQYIPMYPFLHLHLPHSHTPALLQTICKIGKIITIDNREINIFATFKSYTNLYTNISGFIQKF